MMLLQLKPPFFSYYFEVFVVQLPRFHTIALFHVNLEWIINMCKPRKCELVKVRHSGSKGEGR